jgi:ComEC/Rec2-related protein
MPSPSLFRFVFWVFIIYSVLLRQYLWLNYSYLTKEREQVRVKDVILICGKCQQSKYNFLFTNISAKNIDFLGKKTELVNSLSSNEVIATGVLEHRVTGEKFSGLVLREAQIESVVSRPPILTRAFISFLGWADRTVDYFGFTLGQFFSSDESALIQGLLTGRLDGAGTEFINKLKSSGLLHLAAASGYNVAMVISLGWGLSFWILPRRFVKYFVMFFVTLFMFVSNFSPSVVRAGIMGLTGYWAAEIAGSRRSAKRIFLATAGLLLFLFPGWLYDIGFQLSFAATAGMLWVEERINQLSVVIPAKAGIYLNRFRVKPGMTGRNRKGLWSLFSESLAANLSVAPVLIWHFGWKQLGIWGILLNIPAGFLVGPLMGLGMAILIFGSWAPLLAQAVAMAGKPLLALMMGLIEIGARLK